MQDITLVSVPYTIVESPPLGISVLKGAVEAEGFACRTLDLGMELFVYCNKNRKLFDSVQQYLSSNTVALPETIAILDRFIDHWSQTLVDTNSRWIGISVFSYYAQHASFLLSTRIKQLNPDQKIVLGGAGASVTTPNSAARPKAIKAALVLPDIFFFSGITTGSALATGAADT
jgi:hypothetical protein